MNILILKDKAIRNTQLKRVLDELTAFYKMHGNITIDWTVEEKDYSDMEASTTPGIFDTLSERYLRSNCKAVYQKHAEAVDHVIFLVHKDRWSFGRYWGENFSNHFSGYQTQVCRYDDDNPANSVGTIYHEMHHAHDAFIYKYTGQNMTNLIGYKWDLITHGERQPWKYIRYNENANSLIFISTLLKEAVEKRRAIWNKKKNQYMTIITLAEQLLILLRTKLKTK